MPCRVEPSKSYLERQELNAKAGRLLEWIETKMGLPQLDDTGRLCARIRSIDNKEFWQLIGTYIAEEEEARDLAAWWKQHQEYDAKYGRE